jgi:hypothetical protein
MLTRRDYEDLWVNPAPGGFGMPLHIIPNYYQYLQREVYFQDYLDLFGCKSIETFPRTDDNYIDPGFVILHDPTYTKIINGKVYLKVDYDFPYKKELCKNRCIKYIMIGEAAPSKSGTYFYDINQINTTSWLSAPLKAFFNAGMTTVPYMKPTNSIEKRDLLLELAKQGYLLIDLFPFAVNYNNIRERLNQEFEGISISETFYKYLKSYIESNINELKYLNTEITIAFSGPTKTHHFLAYKISLNPLLIPFGCRIFNHPNYFGAIIPLSPIVFPLFYSDWINPNVLNLIYHYVGINRVPFYRCCSYDPRKGTLHPPHELFIRNAFDLP